jgi:hypothetical protein
MHKVEVTLTNDQFDTMVVEELIRSRDAFLGDLGANNHVFVYGDQEADDIEIQKHIESLNTLINWFATPEQLKKVYGDEV